MKGISDGRKRKPKILRNTKRCVSRPRSRSKPFPACPPKSGTNSSGSGPTPSARLGTVSNGNAGGKRISSYFLRFLASSSCRRIYPSYLMDSSACSTASRVAARSSGSQARSIAPVTPGRPPAVRCGGEGGGCAPAPRHHLRGGVAPARGDGRDAPCLRPGAAGGDPGGGGAGGAVHQV